MPTLVQLNNDVLQTAFFHLTNLIIFKSNLWFLGKLHIIICDLKRVAISNHSSQVIRKGPSRMIEQV